MTAHAPWSRAGPALASALLLGLLALRLPVSLDDQDSVDFARGLVEFDPLAEQPHFPGYPLYIAVCRAASAAGLPEPLALALPGVLAAALLVPATAAVAGQLGLRPAARRTALLLLVAHPLLLAEGPRPAPDLLGTCALWCALALALGGRPRSAGALFAAALGVRPDLAACAGAALAAPQAARARLVQGAALAAALWLPAALAAYPPGSLLGLLVFARQHLTVFGSTLLAGAGDPAAALGNLCALGPGLAAWALAGAGLGRLGPHARRVLGLALGPYFAWVLIGQNLAHARHLLPLVPAAALLAAHALTTLAAGRGRAAACVALALCALPAYAPLREAPLDGRAAVARTLRARGECVAVYAGSEQRLFEHYAPAGAAYQRAEVAEIRRDLLAWDVAGPCVLATSGVRGAAALGRTITHLGRGLDLYRIETAALR